MYSALAQPAATRACLEAHGLATKHRLGQNFLVNDRIIEQIVKLSGIEDAPGVAAGSQVTADTVADKPVRILEVGPGIGTLSIALAARAAALICLEADTTLEPALKANLAPYPHARVIYGDALKADAFQVAAAFEELSGAAGPTHFISNLPYQVAATLILQFMRDFPSLTSATVMVQAEVADRICAAPGSKIYGAYSAKLALYAKSGGRFEVAPSNFLPVPHVMSAVIRLDRTHEFDFLSQHQKDEISQVINQAFAQRRKTLRNNLKSLLTADTTKRLEAAGFELSLRAEVLSPARLVELAQLLI